MEDRPDERKRRIFISDPVLVEDLAKAMHLKPFKVVAKLIQMRHFKHANETIDFGTASLVAKAHGYFAERLLPDSL
jgi:hypothetical protein